MDIPSGQQMCKYCKVKRPNKPWKGSQAEDALKQAAEKSKNRRK